MYKQFAMLISLVLLPCPAAAQIAGRCVSGCNIPNPQQQQPQGPQLDPRLVLVGVTANITGDVTFVYPNGDRVRAGPQTPIVLGAHVITGPGAQVTFLLLDETRFTIGGEAEMVIDRFVYDPAHANVVLRIAKGAFRWVSGRVRPPVRDITVNTPVAGIGIRGTDVEINVDPSGSGSVILHEGEVVVEEYDSHRPVTMQAGQSLRWENFRMVGAQ